MRSLPRRGNLCRDLAIASMLALLNASAWSAESTEYHFNKGDRNFPEENPRPLQTFVLKGSADPKLDLVFYTTWSVYSSEPDCEWGHVGLFVAIPLRVTWNGDRFNGVVALDGMLPGRCHWRFGDVRVAPREELVNLGYAFGGRVIVQTNSPPLPAGTSPDSVRQFQCAVLPSNPGKKFVDCGPQFPPVWWYPATRTIEVEFHRRP